jgi:nucleotide-binding universal stress UspA family protein
MPRNVLIPCDESENTKKTLQFYKEKLSLPDDLVILVHVRRVVFNRFDLELDTAFTPSSSELEELDGIEQNRSTDLLKDYAKPFEHSKLVSCCGDPRKELVHKIDELKPDFVVMGKRGLGKLSRLLIGSVSDHILHHVHCPVMVVS